MNNQTDFSLVLEKVKTIINDMITNEMYLDCKFDTLIDNEFCYRVIVEFDNCMGEIIVEEPYFAPYRYVGFQILSKLDTENEFIFVWYDDENSTVEEIVAHINEGMEFAAKY